MLSKTGARCRPALSRSSRSWPRLSQIAFTPVDRNLDWPERDNGVAAPSGGYGLERKRIYELDWIRVLAFGILMFYHTGMVFVGWDFHIMNEQVLVVLAPLMMFVNQWRLSLLFAISGAGTWFALGRRSAAGFAAAVFVDAFAEDLPATALAAPLDASSGSNFAAGMMRRLQAGG